MIDSQWYQVGDSCVPSNSIEWFASDCTVQFNNEAPDHGKEAVQKVRFLFDELEVSS